SVVCLLAPMMVGVAAPRWSPPGAARRPPRAARAGGAARPPALRPLAARTREPALLPLAIQRVGLDPAVSSTPFIASLVDFVGSHLPERRPPRAALTDGLSGSAFRVRSDGGRSSLRSRWSGAGGKQAV